MQNFLFTQGTQGPRDLNLIQSTPMVHPAISRISALPMAFQLSPIIHQKSPDYENSSALDNNDTVINNNASNKISGERLFSGDSFNTTNNTRLEPSTWIGGKK